VQSFESQPTIQRNISDLQDSRLSQVRNHDEESRNQARICSLRRDVPSKRRLAFNGLYGVISRKIELIEVYHVLDSIDLRRFCTIRRFLKKNNKDLFKLHTEVYRADNGPQFNLSANFQARVPGTDFIEIYLTLQEFKLKT
jgi:hypothetical protein